MIELPSHKPAGYRCPFCAIAGGAESEFTAWRDEHVLTARDIGMSNSPHPHQSLAQHPHLSIVLGIDRKQTPVALMPGHRRAQSPHQLRGRSR